MFTGQGFICSTNCSHSMDYNSSTLRSIGLLGDALKREAIALLNRRVKSLVGEKQERLAHVTQHPPYRSDILSRLPPSSESNECHFSCGSRGLAKCWRLAPILPRRLAYILPTFSTNIVEGSIELFPPEGARLKSAIGALYCLGEALNTIRKAYDRTRTQDAHRPAIHTISHKTQCGRARRL